MNVQRIKKLLFAFALFALLAIAQGQSASAAKRYDYSNLSIQTTSAPGSIRSGETVSGISGCDISYSTLVTITFNSLDGTGSSNAQADIQAALNYAREYYQDGTMFKVIIPSGTYRLDYHLFIYDNTWLYLQSDTTLVKNYDKSCMIKSNDNQSMYYGYDGASNIVIEGGIWYTDTSAFSGESTAIRFGHGSDVYLKNVVVDGNSNGHHVSFCGVKDITIENCTFQNYVGSNNKEAVQLDICHSENIVGEYGYYDDTCEQNVLVTGCKFANVSRGIGAHSAVYGVYYNDIAIKGCTFENVDKQAILGMNFKNFVVTENTMTDVGSGIQLRYANPDGENYYQPNAGTASSVNENAAFVASDNNISTRLNEKQSNSYGIYVAGGVMNGNTYMVENATISGNTISSAAHAIYLEYTNSSTVTNNTVENITLNSKSAPSNAICLTNSDNNTISGNMLGSKDAYQLIGHGISLRSGSTGNIIKSNTVNKAKRAGIIIADGSSAKIQNNTIYAAGVSGIIITDKGTRASAVSGNKITASATMGISISADATATASKNTISKSKKYGINVDHAKATLTSNKISGSKSHGINVVNSANATIKSNTITGSTNHAICFTSAKGSAIKNTCKNNGGLGVCCLYSKSVKISGNKFSKNKKGEIYKGDGK
jgi:parallel beta-helix repeat protein